MFGYVVPLKCALGQEAFDQFKAVYCGLCHTLNDRYGFFARFILNYDFTFLAMLLAGEEEKIAQGTRRCPAKPLKKCPYYLENAGLHQAAGCSLILFWYKLQDGIDDGKIHEKMAYRFLQLFIRGAYKKARMDFPQFDHHTADELRKLTQLEREQSGELDLVADTFSRILAFAAEGTGDDETSRIYRELFYHTGRLIYLLDAYDDLPKDRKKGNYNPLVWRFTLLEDGKLSESDKEYLETTMRHSANIAASAYHLLPPGQFAEVLDNIIYHGFPAVKNAVLEGTFRKKQRKPSFEKQGVEHESI